MFAVLGRSFPVLGQTIMSLRRSESNSSIGKAGIEINDLGDSSEEDDARSSQSGSDSGSREEDDDDVYTSKSRGRSRSRGVEAEEAAMVDEEGEKQSWADIVGMSSGLLDLGGARYFAPDRVDSSLKCFNCSKPGHSKHLAVAFCLPFCSLFL